MNQAVRTFLGLFVLVGHTVGQFFGGQKLLQLAPTSSVTASPSTTQTIVHTVDHLGQVTLASPLPAMTKQYLTQNVTNDYVTNNTGDTINNYTTQSTVNASWASPDAIGTTIPNSAAFTTLSVGTSGSPFKVLNTGRQELSFVGDSGSLSSSGGALFIDNTNNIGTGIGIYSNAGAEANGNMINVKVDNPAYSQAAFYMNYDGSSNAVEITNNGSDSSSNALAVTGNNLNDSTLGIIGYELAKGTIKVTHYRSGSADDSNASGLSIDLKGVGTRAQGVYVNSTETGGTLGNLLRLRNQSIDQFVVDYKGDLTMVGNLAQGANGTNTTFTKQGNVAGDQFFVGTTGAFRVQRSASNSEAFRVQINGDTQGRWLGTSDGQLKWGDGTDAQDVTLARGGVGYLTLDGAMRINNSNGNNDFVVKGATDSNLLYVDASADSVGIGLSSPISPLEINKSSSTATETINQTGTGNLLDLQNSGTSKFTVTNAGALVSAAGTVWKPASDATNALQIANSTGSSLVDFDTTNQRVGIGTSAPGSALEVASGDIWLENGGAYRIKDNTGSAKPVLAFTTSNNVQLYNYASSGIVQIGLNNSSNTAGNIRFFTGANTEKMRIDPAGVAIGGTSFGSGAANELVLANGTAPSSSVTGGVQLFGANVAGSEELQVRDEAGNVTTLSPHNFSAIPDGKSEALAWSFYSQRDGIAINADMTKALRLIEQLTGQQVLYFKDLSTGQYIDDTQYEKPEVTDEAAQSLAQQGLATIATWTDSLWTFLHAVTFAAEATFQAPVHFLSDVAFSGKVKVSADTAGSVTIPAGSQSMAVTFAHAYDVTPLVYITPISASAKSFSVGEISSQGFTIHLDQAQAQDLQFNWLAVVASDDQDVKEQVTGASPISSPQPPEASPSPSPSLIPSPTASASSDVSQQPLVSPSPTPPSSPAASPIPSPSPDVSSSPTASGSGVLTNL